MNEFVIKYKMLDNEGKKEVNSFLDFLLSKKKKKITDISTYKERILDVSVWSNNDLKIFEENRKYFNNWNIEQW